jgi:hypothetical protein
LHLYLKECKQQNVTDLVRVCEECYPASEVEAAGIRMHVSRPPSRTESPRTARPALRSIQPLVPDLGMYPVDRPYVVADNTTTPTGDQVRGRGLASEGRDRPLARAGGRGLHQAQGPAGLTATHHRCALRRRCVCTSWPLPLPCPPYTRPFTRSERVGSGAPSCRACLVVLLFSPPPR